MLDKYDQYTKDIFEKLAFPFEKGKKLLDVGCGSGRDSQVLMEAYGLEVWGIDIYTHPKVNEILGDRFCMEKRGIFRLPYNENEFDYVFLHDVLHHIDEENQSYEKHIEGLQSLKRVVKAGGHIIIVEGNRYNPLFYPHMVKMLGHEHFSQNYFKKIILEVFPGAEFKYFEVHSYPKGTLGFWKLYEKLMEKFCPKKFLAYNVAIFQKH